MRSGPDYIQFYPTLRCNKSCAFCFNRPLPEARDISLADFKRMLIVLVRGGVRTLDIIGGEPTLHPEIVAMVALAKERGLLVNLSSNGSDQATLAELVTLGGSVTVGISINDHETLASLTEFIQRYKPVVKSVYSRQVDSRLAHTVLALKPRKYYLIYRDALNRNDLRNAVPFHEYRRAMLQYDPDQVGTVSCSGFIPDGVRRSELANVRCPAGTTKLGILPDGSVYPCNLLFGKEQFRLGNVLHDPFTAIWSNNRLDFFRTFSKNRCPRTSCEVHRTCHGGCPAQSVLLGDDIDTPDPRCIAI